MNISFMNAIWTCEPLPMSVQRSIIDHCGPMTRAVTLYQRNPHPKMSDIDIAIRRQLRIKSGVVHR